MMGNVQIFFSLVISHLSATLFLHQARLRNIDVNKESFSLEISASFLQTCKISVGWLSSKHQFAGHYYRFGEIQDMHKASFFIIFHNYLFPVCFIKSRSLFFNAYFNFPIKYCWSRTCTFRVNIQSWTVCLFSESNIGEQKKSLKLEDKAFKNLRKNPTKL